MTVDEPDALLARLCDVHASTVFFPVRHHSPVAAAMVRRLITELRPAAVLIEGPSDFNPHFDELLRDHELPIAIYSYFGTASGQRSGAFYPFCEYSPEWQALRYASDLGIPVRFIDLPWAETAPLDHVVQRYADAELRRGHYVRMLCERLGVDTFDDLWDTLVEAEPILSPAEFLARVHNLCTRIRLWDDATRYSDERREAFMADRIREAQVEFPGQLLVVTGGYHCLALVQRLEHSEPDPSSESGDAPDITPLEIADCGITLTPYTYERLDSLTGYEAGMPNPGFYDAAWQAYRTGQPLDHRVLMGDLAQSLRERKQAVSTADLIAVETTAQTLAALRGRRQIWRRDLVDAVTSALVKDELEFGGRSPFLAAVHAVLRGSRRGRLADGTRRPPLFADIQAHLSQAQLLPQPIARDVELDLLDAADRERSRLLHRLVILELAGFELVDGTDFLKRTDLSRAWEKWRLTWRYEFDSTCAEAARYGATVAEAAAARLAERAQVAATSAQAAAELLVLAARADVHDLSQSLLTQLEERIRQEPQFLDVSAALGHLLYLYCFDDAFGTAHSARIGVVTVEAFQRAIWLLESLGSVEDDRQLLSALRAILETFERGAELLKLSRAEFLAVLMRVQCDPEKLPQVRGAASGMLWTLGESASGQILEQMLLFSNPEHLGDFLTGLFALAREVAQRDPQLVQALDRMLLEFVTEEFQQALPSLRLAFTFFTPREKHYMLQTLFEALGMTHVAPLDALAVDADSAARALAFEERLFTALGHYGLTIADWETPPKVDQDGESQS